MATRRDAEPAGGEPVEILEANLDRADHQAAIVMLTDAYARDPMGNGAPLPEDVRRALIPGLREHGGTIVFLAFAGDEPIGIANCFRGFSTFAGRPLLNIHDVIVLPRYRGHGIARRIFDAIEHKARALGCCKLTLEVSEGNHAARRLYERVGFGRGECGEGGALLFYVKPL